MLIPDTSVRSGWAISLRSAKNTEAVHYVNQTFNIAPVVRVSFRLFRCGSAPLLKLRSHAAR